MTIRAGKQQRQEGLLQEPHSQSVQWPLGADRRSLWAWTCFSDSRQDLSCCPARSCLGVFGALRAGRDGWGILAFS